MTVCHVTNQAPKMLSYLFPLVLTSSHSCVDTVSSQLDLVVRARRMSILLLHFCPFLFLRTACVIQTHAVVGRSRRTTLFPILWICSVCSFALPSRVTNFSALSLSFCFSFFPLPCSYAKWFCFGLLATTFSSLMLWLARCSVLGPSCIRVSWLLASREISLSGEPSRLTIYNCTLI